VKLHHRIVLPFAAIALIATSATAYVALQVSSRVLRARVEAQVMNAASLVAQSDFALNPAILASVKAISGTDVVTFTLDGRVLASTLGPADVSRATALADGAARQAAIAAAAPILRHADCGAPCAIAASDRRPTRWWRWWRRPPS
jgi:hypothetical protein